MNHACLCGSTIRSKTQQPGYDFFCENCRLNVKVRDFRGLCPIDPLYCSRPGSHKCFNSDEWRGGVVLRVDKSKDS